MDMATRFNDCDESQSPGELNIPEQSGGFLELIEGEHAADQPKRIPFRSKHRYHSCPFRFLVQSILSTSGKPRVIFHYIVGEIKSVISRHACNQNNNSRQREAKHALLSHDSPYEAGQTNHAAVKRANGDE